MQSCSRRERLLPVEATRSIVVAGEANALRRDLGPTSWMVLEELLLRSTGPVDACVASVSVRVLAASLGLAKDTVGRAIRRLRYAGLVTVAQQRTVAGIFDTGTYVVAVPDCIALNAPTPTARPPRVRVEPRHFSQLSLAIES
jgi:DNA-binding transcriptional ArsR family regulator